MNAIVKDMREAWADYITKNAEKFSGLSSTI